MCIIVGDKLGEFLTGWVNLSEESEDLILKQLCAVNIILRRKFKELNSLRTPHWLVLLADCMTHIKQVTHHTSVIVSNLLHTKGVLNQSCSLIWGITLHLSATVCNQRRPLIPGVQVSHMEMSYVVLSECHTAHLRPTECYSKISSLNHRVANTSRWHILPNPNSCSYQCTLVLDTVGSGHLVL